MGASWQWQLSLDNGASSVVTTVPASIYDIDYETTTKATADVLRAAGRHLICYLSAGTWEKGRGDASTFPASVLGNTMADWPDEKWLDIRQVDILMPIMGKRMDICKQKGFEAIEPDNVDGYTTENNAGFPLTAADQITYNKKLAELAHSKGLSIGLKNNIDQVPALAPFFDFAVNEECFAYGECDVYKANFIDQGKPVFHVEYNVAKTKFCTQAKALGFSSLHKTLDLLSDWDPC